MNLSIPTPLAPWLIGVGVVGIVIALGLTIRAYLQSRSGAYYAVREQALRTTGRALLVTLILLALTVVIVLIPKQDVAPASPPTATIRLIPTPTIILTTPTSIATATSTPLPTATEPFIPTATSVPQLPSTAMTPIPSAVPPPADARIEFAGLAQSVDENGHCRETVTQFSVSVERLYLCYTFDGLLPDVPWTVAWYCGEEYLGGGTFLWEPQRMTGSGFVFLGPAQGYPEGKCEVQVWLADRLQIRTHFEITKTEG